MKRLTFILIAILCTSFGRAQDRFFTFVEGWRNNVGIEYDQEYRVLGLEGLGISGQNGLVMNNLSNNGSILDEVSFSVDTLNSIDIWNLSSTSIWIDDSTLLIPGRTSTGTSNSGALFSYDAEEQVIELLSTHDFAVLTVFFGIEEYSDTSFIVLSRETETGMFTSAYVHCIKNDGTELWSSQEMSTGQAWNYTLPHDILHLSSGDIAVLIWEHDTNQPAFHDRWRARLTLIDDIGTILWTRYPGDEENYRIRPGGITEQDGDILVAFSDPEYYDETGEWQPSPSNRVRFELYDTLGTLLSSDSLDELNENINARRTVSQIQHLTDGNLLVSGYHELLHGFLAKITPSLETIWLERYTPYEYVEGEFPDFSTQILNTIETSDGGFLCTGMFSADPGSEPHPSGIQTAIALKVDEFGCLVENCFVGLEEVNNTRVSIFPNPVSEYLTIEIGAGIEAEEIHILDLSGRLVSKVPFSNEVYVSQLDNGLYLLRLLSKDRIIYSDKLIVE